MTKLSYIAFSLVRSNCAVPRLSPVPPSRRGMAGRLVLRGPDTHAVVRYLCLSPPTSSPSQESNSGRMPHEIRIIVWNMKVHCRVIRQRHWSIFWAIQTELTPSHLILSRFTLILSSHMSWSIKLSSPHVDQPKLCRAYAFLIVLMRAAFPGHFSFFDLLITSSEEFKLWSSSLSILL
jgi:hypothetical protein